MRMWLLFGWLLLPAALAAYHYGPGQLQLRLDSAQRLLKEAEAAAKAEDWARAESLYGEAIKEIPADRVAVIRRVRLEQNKARLMSGQLPAAYDDLEILEEELEGDQSRESQKLLLEAKSLMASARFYLTWLMRLEGQPEEEWEPEIEAARQSYRYLAEYAEKTGDAVLAAKAGEDLEAAIRLARMDLAELQGKTLPCQCCGCKSGQCKGKGKKAGKSKGKTNQEQKPKDVRSAGVGGEPETGGH